VGKFMSAIFLGALAIGLSIFTGSRTLDLLSWALPASQQVYQWLGLCAFEGGMMFWCFYFIKGAKGTPQRSISLLMGCFSIIAVGVATVADLNIDAAAQGKVAQLPPAAAQALIIFMGVVIVLNVAAYMACHLLSVENMRQMKEQEAEDKIYDAGLRAISALAPSIANEAAPHLAAEWANRTWDRIVPGVRHETRYLGPATLAQTASLPEPPQQKSIDTSHDAVTSRPGKVASFLHSINPLKEKPATQQPRPGRQESIDSSVESEDKTRLYRDAQRARRAAPSRVLSPVAAQRLAHRSARHGRLSPAAFVEEVEVSSPPLAKKSLPVSKKGGAYIVNKKPLPPLHVND
jgi:hypothetical protein